MPRAGTEIVETPNDGVRDDEGVVLEEKIPVLAHALRPKNPDVAARYAAQEMSLLQLAVFLEGNHHHDD